MELMPQTVLSKKNKIFLSDFQYKREIENRLFMASLTPFEVTALQEIIHSSIKIPISDLCDALSCPEYLLLPVFEKFCKIGLITRQKDSLYVDKSLRKYFEFHIQKFDNGFVADIEFLLGILSMIPISILPIWYGIPRSSDNIFQSLIEKYFLTPKIYQKYLDDLVFDEEHITAIKDDLFQSPNLALEIPHIREKYSLSKEKLKESLLLLELHFVGAETFDRNKEDCKGILKPFLEFRQYLVQTRKSPATIEDTSQIITQYSEDFGFLLAFQSFLNEVMNGTFVNQEIDSHMAFVNQAWVLGFVQKPSGPPQLKQNPRAFLEMSPQNQAALIYRYAAADYAYNVFADHKPTIECVERSFREVENGLRKVIGKGWIFFDDFFNNFNGHIGNSEPVTLKKVGKTWSYVTPVYTPCEAFFIEQMIFKTLFRAGIAATGKFQDRLCFAVTKFGKKMLTS